MESNISFGSDSHFFDLKNKITSILWLTFIWLLIALYQYADGYTVLLEQNCIDENYDVWAYIVPIIFSATTGSILAGGGLIFVWDKWLRTMKFITAMTYIVLCYTSIYVLLTFSSVAIFGNFNPSINNSQSIWSVATAVLLDFNQLPNYIFWLSVLLLTLILLLVKDKIGPGIFGSFLTGRYFHPRREEKIFLFMDLKSSTSIAENLGEEKYFNFLNDTFKTVTPGILNARGNIYQYVGDEIVISWPKNVGISRANCIRCFYNMNQLLDGRKSYFEEKYGHIPVFKAGMHHGAIIAGEIGIIKRDIVYSGDVLNTASRIQSMCNELNTRLLVSKPLYDQLDVSQFNLETKEIGPLSLKGKEEKIAVVAFD